MGGSSRAGQCRQSWEGNFNCGSFDRLMMSFDRLTMLSTVEAVSKVKPLRNADCGLGCFPR
jgi:hypothetical protein